MKRWMKALCALLVLLAALLAGLHRLESESDPTVERSAYYTEGVFWASENGIVTGYGDGAYKPYQLTTLQQLPAILHRYAGNPEVAGNELNFSDASMVSDYAKAAMERVVANGIIQGKTGGMLDPRGLVIRAQAATMIMRCCGHIFE